MTISAVMDRWNDWRPRFEATGRRVARATFGDRTGYALFLGALVFFALTWRVDFFINDNQTVANTLVALRDGQLYYSEVVYGPESGASPGTHIYDGRLYGNNYGEAFLALPVLLAIEAVALVADVPIAIIAGVSLVLFAFGRQLGALLDRQRVATLASGALTLLFFLGNTALAVELSSRWYPFLALQITTMVVAGLAGVMLYRLCHRMYDARAGVFAGVVLVVASPVGFWSTIPKRHNLVALLTLLVMYSLFRSRQATDRSTALRFNALAYVWVGLTAWVLSAQALVLLAGLGVADFLSNPWVDVRRVAAIGVAFAVSLVPFAVTNALISGNPFLPPRLLPSYRGEETVLVGDTPPAGPEAETSTPAPEKTPTPTQPEGNETPPAGTDTGRPQPDKDGRQSKRPDQPSPSPLGIVGRAIGEAMTNLSKFVEMISAGFDAIRDSGRLYRVFIDGGFVTGKVSREPEPRLAVLESMPVAGLLWLLPLEAVGTDPREVVQFWQDRRPTVAVDVFTVVYSMVLVLVYLPSLPLHAQITTRYLHTLYPLVGYALVRTALVRTVLRRAWRTLWFSYAATVLVGGQLFLAYLATAVGTRDAAVFLSGQVALGSALLLAGWGLLSVVDREDRLLPAVWTRRAGGAALGLAAGVTTVFVLLSAIEYFELSGRFALPVMRMVAEAIQTVM